MPKVSIVTPVLNPGAFFEAALTSILTQSFQDFEFIAIDSASTDGTLERLRAVDDPRLRLITLPAPCGGSTPSNLGISLARGDYIAIMDSDDVMHRDRLARQVAFLEANDTVDVLGTSYTISFNGELHRRDQPTEDPQIKALMLLMNSSSLHNPTVMFRRRFQREHNLFFPPRLTDWDNALWLAMMKAGGTFANLPDNLLTYNSHPANNSNQHAAHREAAKTPLRTEVLLALLPDLTGHEAEAIAMSMERGRALNFTQAVAGLLAMERASRINTSRYGADLQTVLQILSKTYQEKKQAVQRLLDTKG